MKNAILFGLMLILAMFVSGVMAESSTEPLPTQSNSDQVSEQYVVYYFHMARRCMTCEKLEKYAIEAILNGFDKQLKDSSLVWRLVNIEAEGNEHYAKEYKLFSQSLIISKTVDGSETEWKNMDKIWELVRDKDEYIAYVQNEIKSFMNSTETK